MYIRHAKLYQRLKRVATKRATKLGLGLTPSCNTLIEQMIANGIERMQGQGAADREEHILMAEQNLARYLTKLSEEAQAIGSYPLVGARVFDNVLKDQCPVWPFC